MAQYKTYIKQHVQQYFPNFFD